MYYTCMKLMFLKISGWHRINLTMVQSLLKHGGGGGGGGGGAPFKPRRTTRPHTRLQGVGQNEHTSLPFSRMGEGGAFTTGMMYPFINCIIQFSD